MRLSFRREKKREIQKLLFPNAVYQCKIKRKWDRCAEFTEALYEGRRTRLKKNPTFTFLTSCKHRTPLKCILADSRYKISGIQQKYPIPLFFRKTYLLVLLRGFGAQYFTFVIYEYFLLIFSLNSSFKCKSPRKKLMFMF